MRNIASNSSFARLQQMGVKELSVSEQNNINGGNKAVIEVGKWLIGAAVSFAASYFGEKAAQSKCNCSCHD